MSKINMAIIFSSAMIVVLISFQIHLGYQKLRDCNEKMENIFQQIGADAYMSTHTKKNYKLICN
jgi:hypothetical protein